MKTNQLVMPRGTCGRGIFFSALLTLALGLLFSGPVAAQTTTWTLDPVHTAAHFTVRHLVVNYVRGGFTKTSGTVQYDPKDPSKMAIQATIDATSEDTGVAARDNDVKTNYLEIDKYPTITFQSKRAEPAGEGKIKVTGDLTIHGVTKEVALDVSDITGPVTHTGVTHMGALASTTISRKDFGITKNTLLEAGGAIVGDEVVITIDIDATQGSAPPRVAAPPAPRPTN